MTEITRIPERMKKYSLFYLSKTVSLPTIRKSISRSLFIIFVVIILEKLKETSPIISNQCGRVNKRWIRLVLWSCSYITLWKQTDTIKSMAISNCTEIQDKEGDRDRDDINNGDGDDSIR